MNSIFPESIGRLKLDDHRIINPQTGETILAAAKQPSKNDRYYRRLAENNLDYFAASKKLGDISKEILQDTLHSAIDLATHSDSPSEYSLQSESYELAASAVHELAFIRANEAFQSNEPDETIDERIQLIDEGDELLKRAVHSLSSQPMTTLEQRLNIKLQFSNVLKDIVCGELTAQTVDETRALLDEQLYRTYDNADSIHARGLGGEIRTLLKVWNSYEKTGDVIALPSTVRGDSGFKRREETHDLDTLRQGNEGQWIIETPIEVKRRKISRWMLDRYICSDLVQVRVGGNVNLVQQARK